VADGDTRAAAPAPATSALDPRLAAARRTADSARALIRALINNGADPDVLDDVARTLDGLTATLAPTARTSRYEGNTGVSEPGTVQPSPVMETHTVIGPASPMSPPMVVETRDGRVHATATYDVRFEGPPRSLHGGYVASAFDLVLASAAAVTGKICMTASLTVQYRKATPLGTELVFEGWPERTEGRVVHTAATCTADGVVTAEATGVFVDVGASRYQLPSD
jgi:acyl-coenzyme A thioesterase PaaI-like protein